MFGLGLTEILFLCILGLILIKPEDLPGVARSIGRFLNELKRNTEHIRAEFSAPLREDPKEREDVVPSVTSPTSTTTDVPPVHLAHDLSVERSEPAWAKTNDEPRPRDLL